MFAVRVAAFMGIWAVAAALYEDQVGKWDWLQKHIGPVELVNLGLISTGSNIIVATQSNVLAALNSRNGKLVWRKLLEEDSRGTIRALSLRGNPVLVTGSSPPLVRSFHAANGALNWETRLPSTAPKNSDQKHFIDADGMRVISVYTSDEHVVISDFSYASQKMKTSPPIAAPFARAAQCGLIDAAFYVCLDNSGSLQIVSLEHSSQEFVRTELKSLDIPSTGLELKSLPEGPYLALRSDTKLWLVEITNEGPKLLKHFDGLKDIINFKTNGLVYHVLVRSTEASCLGLSVLDPQLREVDGLDSELCIPDVFSSSISSLMVTGVTRRDGGLSYRALVTTRDAAVIMFQREGRVMWSREEALSEVTNAQFVDLPLSEIEAQIEEEFMEKPSDIVSMFLKRVYSQMQQVASLFEPKNPLSKNFGLVRDNFGFHKVIFMATHVGKFFLIDNLSGEILWSKFVPEMRPFVNGQYIIATQRTTAHFPHPPVLTVLGRTPSGGSRVLSINPITGQVLDEKNLALTITQTSLLPPNEDFLKGILLFDESTMKVEVYPTTYDHKHYLLSAGREGIVKGFLIENGKAKELWVMRLAIGSRVEAVAVKGTENVHSQGRVLGDRTVLYKYTNPNLAAVLSYSAQQSYIFVYLLDVVTGAIVYQGGHPKARGPIHAVHSENWLVYSYISEKMRRQEISALDLYVGLDQPNDTFSSFSAPQPKVEHATFILPDHIVHMKDTVTEKGITSKLILAANAQGSLLEIPKAMLDPRRPVNPTALHREEGLIPYVPEIIVPPQNILNYNQTVARMRGIETAPSGLESTCLVLAYGLDMYYTRVAPSQNFDILKDNFDHLLICAVLVGLILASYVTKALAARKALKAAWK